MKSSLISMVTVGNKEIKIHIQEHQISFGTPLGLHIQMISQNIRYFVTLDNIKSPIPKKRMEIS